MKMFDRLPSTPASKRKKNLSTENLHRYFKNAAKPSRVIEPSSVDNYNWSPLSSSTRSENSLGSGLGVSCSDSSKDINFIRMPSGDVDGMSSHSNTVSTGVVGKGRSPSINVNGASVRDGTQSRGASPGTSPRTSQYSAMGLTSPGTSPVTISRSSPDTSVDGITALGLQTSRRKAIEERAETKRAEKSASWITEDKMEDDTEGVHDILLDAQYDTEKVKKAVSSHSVWSQTRLHKKAFRVAFRLLEAKGIPMKHGYFFVVKLKSATDPTFKDVEWTTPLSYSTPRVQFSLHPAMISTASLAGLVMYVQMWMVQKAPKLISESSVSLEIFPANGLISKDLLLHKATIASLQFTIVAINILPNDEYQPFVLSLVDNNMKITRRVLTAIGENQLYLGSLLHVLSSVNAATYLIDRVLCAELNDCDSLPTLFREDNLNIIVLDTYIQLVGHDYLIEVLQPFVKQVLQDRPECELGGDISKNDLARNIQTLTGLMNKLLDIITASDDYCPPALRVVLRKVYSFSMKKWPDDLDGWVTAVTGFLFLRFFVPALLHPCEYKLCQPWEIRYQEKTTLFNLGIILQKMANLGMFSTGPNNFHMLNTSIQLGGFIIYQWVTAICHTEPKKAIHNPNISETLGFNATLLARYCAGCPTVFTRLGSTGKGFLEVVQEVLKQDEKLATDWPDKEKPEEPKIEENEKK